LQHLLSRETEKKTNKCEKNTNGEKMGDRIRLLTKEEKKILPNPEKLRLAIKRHTAEYCKARGIQKPIGKGM